MDPIKEALTFDDVTLAPKDSSVLPSEVNTSVKLSKNLNLKTIENLQKAEKELCIEWKSDLQLEWSQHLWRFFGDLHLLKKRLKKENKKKLEEFTKRRYSEPLSQQLLDE